MKAIETIYRNVRFRSRTEARWAVFFSNLGIKWEYEEEGFEIENGRRYLPDFKILTPDSTSFYCEVKPNIFDDLGDSEIETYRVVSQQSNTPFLILAGQPDIQPYNLIMPNHSTNSFCAALFQDYSPYVMIADKYWFEMFDIDENTGRFIMNMDDRRASKAFGKNYLNAIKEARGARFEHGEQPK